MTGRITDSTMARRPSPIGDTTPAIQGNGRDSRYVGKPFTVTYDGPLTSQADVVAAVPAPDAGEYFEARKAQHAFSNVQTANTTKIRQARGALRRAELELGEAFDAAKPKHAAIIKAGYELKRELTELHHARDMLNEAGKQIAARVGRAERTDAFKAWRRAEHTVKKEYQAIEVAARSRWDFNTLSSDKHAAMMTWCEAQYLELLEQAKAGKFS